MLISHVTPKDLTPTFDCSSKDAYFNSRADLFFNAKPVFSLFQQSDIAKLMIATSFDGFAYEKVIADMLETALFKRKKVLCYISDSSNYTAKVFEIWADKAFALQQTITELVTSTPITDDLNLTEYLVNPKQSDTFNILISQLNEFNIEQRFKLLADVYAPDNQLIYAANISESDLFGEQAQSFKNNSYDSQVQHLIPGYIHYAHSGYLLIKINDLLIQPMLWFKLKQILISGKAEWNSSSAINSELHAEPAVVDFKLILLGEKESISRLAEIDTELSSIVASFVEFDAEFNIQQQSVASYLTYIDLLITEHCLHKLTLAAQQQILRVSTRWCEHNNYFSLNENRLVQLLSYSNIISAQHSDDVIRAKDVEQALELQHQALNSYVKLSSESVAEKQVLFQTQGHCIGQINGLSVLELSGHPESFGEPVRITATAHLSGDGEISDIERKAELAGNIHAKAMMIIQGYFTHIFAKPLPLPLSANLAFEQSYGEIDGDSAALAGSCALLSALSQLPIKQNIAVTGAIDQFGNVLAVGGINEKIEGFYRICQIQDQQNAKVIIPAANLINLNLSSVLIEAVNENRLTILPVDSIEDAIYILMDKPAGDIDDENSVYGTINKLADNDDEATRFTVTSKIINFYKEIVTKLGLSN